MKKHLIAAAVAAAVAVPAMAQVEVYGIIDMGYSSEKKQTAGNIRADATVNVATAGVEEKNTGINTSKNSDTSGLSNAIGGSSGLSGSRLGFRGTEDLGGGLKAGFVLEAGLNQGNSAVLFGGANRAANVFLSGSFGEVRIGRQNTIGKTINDTYTAIGGGGSFEQGSVALEVSRGSELGSSDPLNRRLYAATQIGSIADRTSNGVIYTSPRVNGFGVSAMLATNEFDGSTAAAGKISAKAQGITASYVQGPLSVHVGHSKADLEGRITTTYTAGTANIKDKADLTQIGARYNLGDISLFALYNDGQYKPGTAGQVSLNSKGYDIGATYTVGNVRFVASFGNGEVDEALGEIGLVGTVSTALAGTTKATADVDGYLLQAHYLLSKRTTAYVIYGQTKVDRATRLASGNTTTGVAPVGDDAKSSATMFGIRHTF